MNVTRVEARSYIFQENIGFSLNWIALQCLKPMHYTSELFIHSYFTPIRPGEFGNLSTKTLERVSRAFQFIFCVVVAPVALVGLGISFALDSLGDYMTQKSYMKLVGNAEEKKSCSKPSFMTLNACMLWGGLPILFGGVRPARERIDEVANLILEQDPDVLVMQEMSFESGRSLWDKLKDTYASGFTRISPMPGFSLDSGLFIACKLPIVTEPIFYPLPSHKIIKKGFFYFETEKHAVFVAHLVAGDEAEDAAVRKEQLDAIVSKMQKARKELSKECLLLGDLNINLKRTGNDEYSTSKVSEFLANDTIPCEITEETANCTNRLIAYAKGQKVEEENAFEHIDYALRLRTPFGTPLTVRLVATYDLNQPDRALSDHKGLFVCT
jgi:endonuclease/exonuclease/phosphatase family metal-dependent hydrolase